MFVGSNIIELLHIAIYRSSILIEQSGGYLEYRHRSIVDLS